MNGPVLGLIVLILIVFVNAKRPKNDDDGLSLDLSEQSLIRRYLLDKYLLFNQREVSTFTEAQQKFQNDSLNTHNTLRALHCVPPLILSDEINVRAQIYAEYLASIDSTLIHSKDRAGIYGENLLSITRATPITNPDGDRTTRLWYSEASLYDYDKPGYTPNIAHFSQIVWKDTKELGIGYAFAREGCKMFVVAQYKPPGNYVFAFSTNVLQPTC